MHLRVLSSLFAAMLCSLVMAQGNTVVVSGHIINCSPAIASGAVNIHTVGLTQPAQSVTVQMNENCYFHHTFTMDSEIGLFMVTGICMDGTVAMDSVSYTAAPNVITNVNVDLWCGGGAALDCNGVPGGSAVPYTACDDNDPNTFNDHWTSECVCAGGDCLADFSLSSTTPYILDITNLSVGTGLTYEWHLPFNQTSHLADPASIEFPQTNAYGVYDICLVLSGANCQSWHCDTLYVDANGGITFTQPAPWDCEGVMGGSALPGTPCDDNDPMTTNDHWTAGCECMGTTTQGSYWITVTGHIYPCSPAIAGGLVTITSVQGTSPAFTQTASIHSNCSYSASFLMDDPSGWFQVTGGCGDGTSDSNIGSYGINTIGGDTIITIDLDCGTTTTTDCEGVMNGPAMPGTPCDDGDPATFNDHWTADCNCMGSAGPGDCTAGYWVIQAMDSANGQIEPIPYELWVWNLSEGNGTMHFVWDFGDGTTSTEPYPTHIYGDSGPYLLCLSMVDATGCTDTYCDIISVDSEGISGMTVGSPVRNALTLNVIQSLPSFTTGVEDASSIENVSAWPNPASDLLNISLNSTITGATRVTIIDLNGAVVRTLNSTFIKGTNQFTIPIMDLADGMYSIRIENGRSAIAQRFVKH